MAAGLPLHDCTFRARRTPVRRNVERRRRRGDSPRPSGAARRSSAFANSSPCIFASIGPWSSMRKSSGRRPRNSAASVAKRSSSSPLADHQRASRARGAARSRLFGHVDQADRACVSALPTSRISAATSASNGRDADSISRRKLLRHSRLIGGLWADHLEQSTLGGYPKFPLVEG